MTEAETTAQPTHRRRGRGFAAAAILIGVAMLSTVVWFGRSAATRWWGRGDSALPGAAAGTALPAELYRNGTERLHVYYREGNVDKAIADLERALQLKSPYPLAEARLSLAYWRKNAVTPDPHWRSQALTFAQSAVRGDPQLAVAQMAEGAALAVAGRVDEAAAAYTRATTLDPTSPELLWRLGDLAFARKDPKGAEAYYRRAVEAGKNEWEPHVRLGGFFYREGRYEEALQAYERARSIAPDHARVYANLAAVYHQLDRTDEAAAVLQRSLEIAPDTVTYSNLGTLLYFEGRYAEAVSAFERGVELGAATYLRWGNLADAQRMVATERAKAHASYKTAIRLVREHLHANPTDVNARSTLAVYLVRDEQPQEALTELNAVLAQTPLIPGTLFNCSVVAELTRQRSRALELLGRAMAAGYQLREITHEPDLVNLRTDPGYYRLISRDARQGAVVP